MNCRLHPAAIVVAILLAVLAYTVIVKFYQPAHSSRPTTHSATNQNPPATTLNAASPDPGPNKSIRATSTIATITNMVTDSGGPTTVTPPMLKAYRRDSTVSTPFSSPPPPPLTPPPESPTSGLTNAPVIPPGLGRPINGP